MHGLEEAEKAGIELPSGVHALLITIGNAYRETVARPEVRDNIKRNGCLLSFGFPLAPVPACVALYTQLDDAFDPRTPAAFGQVATALLDEGIFQFTADGVVAWGIANLVLAGSSRTWPNDEGARQQILAGG